MEQCVGWSCGVGGVCWAPARRRGCFPLWAAVGHRGRNAENCEAQGTGAWPSDVGLVCWGCLLVRSVHLYLLRPSKPAASPFGMGTRLNVAVAPAAACGDSEPLARLAMAAACGDSEPLARVARSGLSGLPMGLMATCRGGLRCKADRYKQWERSGQLTRQPASEVAGSSRACSSSRQRLAIICPSNCQTNFTPCASTTSYHVHAAQPAGEALQGEGGQAAGQPLNVLQGVGPG